MTRMAFLRGEPIRRDKLVVAGQGGFMSAILPSGKRAVAIQIDQQRRYERRRLHSSQRPRRRRARLPQRRGDQGARRRSPQFGDHSDQRPRARRSGRSFRTTMARRSRSASPRPSSSPPNKPSSSSSPSRRAAATACTCCCAASSTAAATLKPSVRAANNAAASPSCATARRNKRRDERTRPYEGAISQSSIERSDRPPRARRGARSRARIGADPRVRRQLRLAIVDRDHFARREKHSARRRPLDDRRPARGRHRNLRRRAQSRQRDRPLGAPHLHLFARARTDDDLRARRQRPQDCGARDLGRPRRRRTRQAFRRRHTGQRHPR